MFEKIKNIYMLVRFFYIIIFVKFNGDIILRLKSTHKQSTRNKSNINIQVHKTG